MKSRSLLTVLFFLFVTASAFCNPLFSYVPSDAYLVASFNFAAINAQPELKALFDAQMQKSPNYASEISGALGIDPARDISTVMLFLDQANHPGIIVNGSFSSTKLSELIQSNKELSLQFEIKELEGIQLVSSPKYPNANFLFLDENTIAMGAEDALAVIARVNAAKAKDINNNKAFKYLIARVDTSARVWGAIMPSENWQERVQIPAAGFQKMTTAFFSLDYDKDFIMSFTGLVEKKSELPEFTEAMKNFLDVFRGWTASVPEMTEILKSAKVDDNKENLARIYLSIPAEQFKASMESISKQSAPKAN